MKEFLLIIRYLTVKKIINLIVRTFSIILSRLSKRYVNIGMPWSYSIEPCNICNLKCKECVSGLGLTQRRRGNINQQLYKTAIDNISPYALNLFLYFQGEPTLNKDFCKMVNYAHSKKLYTVTSTNAHFLTAELSRKIALSGLDKLIVSLDGFNDGTYSAYRIGGNFNKVIDGIQNMSNAKLETKSQTPIIEVQTLVTKLNENHLDEIRKLAIKSGADSHVLKSMQIENKDDFQIFKPQNPKYSRYDHNNQLINPIGFCKRIINSAVVTIDGDVLPCCYDKDAQLKLGNLQNSSLKEITKSQTANQIISRLVFQQSNRPNMCKNCGG